MVARRVVLLMSLAAMVMWTGSASGIAPMGPPTSELSMGEFDAGVDYAYSKQDIQLKSGRSPGGGPDITMNNMKWHYVGARVGYGLTETCSGYLMGGGGSARGKDSDAISYNSNDSVGDGYVLGFGLKKTFFSGPSTDWGGLFQAFWAEADGKVRAGGANWTAETEMMEIQLAAGPTHTLNERMKIYGGPFIHLIEGDYMAHRRGAAARMNYDLEEGSWFGGYVGTQLMVMENATFNVEYQHTASADALGMNMTWKF